ncbi:MAG: alpha/beta fold hydrolase [Ilumatobacter sp.]|uniref:alpha/beta fold hydrolase n=1 Tax=Ilumatobacter sp. TaxID=1967498 RepID=UPI003296D431
MDTTRVRGCEIGHDRSGSGIDLVWGHGLTQSRSLEDLMGLVEWADVPATVVRYDARGHGDSESTPDLDDYGWESLALDQLALADALRIDTYVAGGASMGSATALHAAVAAPDRILGLVLVIPPTGWEARSGQTDVYEQGAQIVEASGVEPLIAAGALVPPPGPFVGDPAYRMRRADAMRSWDPQRLARAMRGATRAQLPDRERIAEIACPTLILAWTGDPVHPVATADELARLIPHAEYHLASSSSDISGWTDLIGSFITMIRPSRSV